MNHCNSIGTKPPLAQRLSKLWRGGLWVARGANVSTSGPLCLRHGSTGRWCRFRNLDSFNATQICDKCECRDITHMTYLWYRNNGCRIGIKVVNWRSFRSGFPIKKIVMLHSHEWQHEFIHMNKCQSHKYSCLKRIQLRRGYKVSEERLSASLSLSLALARGHWCVFSKNRIIILHYSRSHRIWYVACRPSGLRRAKTLRNPF